MDLDLFFITAILTRITNIIQARIPLHNIAIIPLGYKIRSLFLVLWNRRGEMALCWVEKVEGEIEGGGER